jgi:hypothetical protein
VQALLFLDAALGADRRQLVKQYVENADGGTQLSQRIWKAAFDLIAGLRERIPIDPRGSAAPEQQSAVEIARARCCSLDSSTISAPTRSFASSATSAGSRPNGSSFITSTCAPRSSASTAFPTVLGHGPNTTQWTVEQEYVFALLIHQLNTGNMTPAELDWAYAQIRGWSRRLSLDAVARSMEGFLVDVGGKTGLVRPLGNDAGLMLRYLDTTSVCDQLDRAVTALRRAESPDASGVLSVNQRRVAILERIRPAIAPNLNANLRRDPRNSCGVTARVRVGLARYLP